MSLNIAPHIPQTIVNAATPTTEALVHTNAIKEVIPAPVQTEAAVPQKSREQDNRAPAFDNPTYDDIQKPDPKVIPEQDADDQQETSGKEEQGSAREPCEALLSLEDAAGEAQQGAQQEGAA